MRAARPGLGTRALLLCLLCAARALGVPDDSGFSSDGVYYGPEGLIVGERSSVRCKLMTHAGGGEPVYLYTSGRFSGDAASRVGPGDFLLDGVLRVVLPVPTGCEPLPPSPNQVLLLRAGGGCSYAQKSATVAAASGIGIMIYEPELVGVRDRADPPEVPVAAGELPCVTLNPESGAFLVARHLPFNLFCALAEPPQRATAYEFGDLPDAEAFLDIAAPVLERLHALVTAGARTEPDPGRGALPRALWLASFPNSGCTWVRRLFEEATGFATEGVYGGEGEPTVFGTFRDSKARPGLPLPAFGAPRVVKCHCAACASLTEGAPWDGVVHLVRHPLDVLAANWRFAKAGGDRGVDADNTDAFLRFAKAQISVFVRWNCAIAGVPGLPRFVLEYNEALRDPRAVHAAAAFGGWRGSEAAHPHTPPRYAAAADPRVPLHLSYFNSTGLVRDLVALLEASIEEDFREESCAAARTVGGRLDLFSGIYW